MKKLLLFSMGVLFCCFTAYGQAPIPIIGADTICVGNSSSYNITPTLGVAYTWSTVSGQLLSSNNNSASVFWASPGSGEVSVFGIDSIGDTVQTGSIDVFVKNNPSPFITADASFGCASQIDPDAQEVPVDTVNCLPMCRFATVTFTANGNPLSTYDWNVIGGVIQSTVNNTVTVQWTTLGFGEISVKETTPNGCEGESELCIEVIPEPTADFGALPDTSLSSIQTCILTEVFFIDKSQQVGSSPIVSWQWDFGDGTTSNSQNPSHIYNTPGFYSVTLTIENACHCVSTYSMDVEVDESEPIEISCPSVVCENKEVRYSVSEELTGCPIYDWDVIGGSFVGSSSGVGFVNIIWDNVDPSGFGYVLVYDNHCGATCPGVPTIIKVPVILNQGEIFGEDVLCINEEGLYKMPQWPATNFQWSFDGNSPLLTTDQPNEVVVKPDSFGQYTLKCDYYNVLTNCGGSAIKTINVHEEGEVIGDFEVCVSDDLEVYELAGGFTGDWVLFGPSGTPPQSSSGNSVSFNFSVPGNYLLTVSGQDFCSPEPFSIKSIALPPQPDSISGPDTICLDVPIEYVAYSAQPGAVFSWEITGGTFAGGSTEALGNKVSAKFNGTGPYELMVKRVSTSPAACESDEITKTMSSKQIDIDIVGLLDVCDNSYQTYNSSYQDGDSYEWTIIPETNGSVVSGDGTDEITILWNTTNPAQTVDIALAVRSCGTIYYDTISVLVRPSVDIQINAPSTICAGEQVTFEVIGNPAITSSSGVNWDFGDGDTNTQNNLVVNHTYGNDITGAVSYTVTVDVVDPNNCSNSASAAHTILVEPAPVAQIGPVGSYDFCPPSQPNVVLTATVQSGLGSTVSYDWHLNGTSLGINASSITANAIGIYYCVVTGQNLCKDTTNAIWFNDDCDNDSTKCSIKNSSRINANADDSGCGLVNVSGQDTVSTGSISYQWEDLSGKATSKFINSASGTFEFTKAGVYMLELTSTVIENGDTCYYSDTALVEVTLIPDLKYAISCGSSGEYDVTIHDRSTYLDPNSISSRNYSVNGTPVQSGNNPSYTGSYPGGSTLDVSLTVMNGIDTCTVMKQITLPNPPIADFDVLQDTICVGAPLMFINNSMPSGGVTYNWEFGDQAETTVDNPSRVYGSPGDKIVSLSVTDGNGCQSSLQKSVFVLRNNLAGNLSAQPQVACEGDVSVIQFNSTGSGIPDYILWQPDTFAITSGVTQSVTSSGSYFATLKSNYGCVSHTNNQETVEFITSPIAIIEGPSNACVGDEIVLKAFEGDGSYDFTWTVNGTPFGTGSELTLMSSTPTTYLVDLEVDGGAPNNCTSVATLEIEVHPLPQNLSAGYSVVSCSPYLVELTASSSEMGVFNWSNGGVGQTLTVSKGGEYTVTFTNENGCSVEDVVYVPKSIEEYIWLYPIGCFTVCQELFNPDVGINLPDPLRSFDFWRVRHEDGNEHSGIGLVDISVGQFGSGLYSYDFELEGCDVTRETLDLNIVDCDCDLEVEIEGEMMIAESDLGCIYQIGIVITNPTSAPIQVTLSSNMGNFSPSVVTVPPGTHSFLVDFIPNPGLMSGTIGSLFAETTFFDDEGNAKLCLTEIELLFAPDELCEGDARYAEESDFDDNQAVFDFGITPNPANDVTEVTYDLTPFAEASLVELQVYNLQGSLVRTVLPDVENQSHRFEVLQLSSGTYLVVFRIDGDVKKVKRMLINH